MHGEMKAFELITVRIRDSDGAECVGYTYTVGRNGHGAHDISVHLLAACPNRSYLEAHGFGLDRYIEHPLVLEAGMALAPTRPGHGVNFDWTALARLSA